MGYIYYCPRCGSLIEESHYKKLGEPKCTCITPSIFKKQITLIKSDIKYENFHIDGSQAQCIFPEWGGSTYTQEMCDSIWNTYVDVPSNKKLDPSAFGDKRRYILQRMKNNAFIKMSSSQRQQFLNTVKENGEDTRVYEKAVKDGKTIYQNLHTDTQISCPKCGSKSIGVIKQGFGVGKAVAGVIAVGPEGALAGAVGANKVFNVCQNCGYQWEPGK